MQTEKRGGGKQIISFDLEDAEGQLEFGGHGKELSPDQDYDQKWAVLLFYEALSEVQAGMARLCLRN